MDQFHIVPDIPLQNGAYIRLSRPGIKSNSKDKFVSGRKIRGELEDIPKCPNFLHGVPKVCPDASQNGIAVAGSQLLFDQDLHVQLDVCGTDDFQFGNAVRYCHLLGQNVYSGVSGFVDRVQVGDQLSAE